MKPRRHRSICQALLLTACCTLQIVTPRQPPPSCSLQQNIDFHGNDISTVISMRRRLLLTMPSFLCRQSQVHGETTDECCTLCMQTPGCGAFTHTPHSIHQQGPTCYLKSRPTNITSTNGRVSGVLSRGPTPPPTPPSCSLQQNTDFFGNDISKVFFA